MFHVFEHTADLGLRVQTKDLDTLFVDAGLGLLGMLIANPDQVRAVHEKHYELEAEQLDYLLFDWLTELLYTFDSEKLLLCQFDVRVQGTHLQATGRGEPMDVTRHDMDHEVKAITYHELKVQQTEQGWLAEIIVDI